MKNIFRLFLCVWMAVLASKAGASFLPVDSGGNIGVGTAAPIGLLDVNRKLTVLSGGNVGVGTSAPVGLLDVNRKVTVLSGGNVGIGSVAPTAKLVIGGGGHLHSQGTAPKVSSCGTGKPAATGNDIAGAVEVGKDTNTCTLTFSTAWTNTPNCVITSNSTASTKAITSLSTTDMTFQASAANMDGETVYYICIGRE